MKLGRERSILYITYMESKKNNTNKLIQKTEADLTDIENKLTVTKEVGGVRDK